MKLTEVAPSYWKMIQTTSEKLWEETKTFAREGSFDRITGNMLAVASIDPLYARQAADKLFKRIVNNYPPFLGNALRLESWLEWVQQSSGWRNTFAKAAFDGDALRVAVDAALADFQAHQANNTEAMRVLAAQVADVLDSVMVRRENAHAAYSQLIRLRHQWNEEHSSSEVRALFTSALSAVGLVRTTSPDGAEGDRRLQQIGELKQRLRGFAARQNPVSP